MRVRHLQTRLSDIGLIRNSDIHQLKGMTIGLDAAHWLRCIQLLKDPYADALGGLAPGVFGIIQNELDAMKELGIKPVFVFDGMVPPLQHQMFQQHTSTSQVTQAWERLANGEDNEAQKLFAVATSRINSDLCYFVLHYLKSKNLDVIRAPYVTGAQLAHMAETKQVQAVFGQPGDLLYGVPRVICSWEMDPTKEGRTFEWVELEAVLNTWNITKPQFIDTCVLAGTEYCLTYPYLNLDPQSYQTQHMQYQQLCHQAMNNNQPIPPMPPHLVNGPSASSFNFDNAVTFVKNLQAPINSAMMNFPSEDMRADHIEGYSICKTLLQHAPVWSFPLNDVRPFSVSTDAQKEGVTSMLVPSPPPQDLQLVLGQKLPLSLHVLMMTGALSYRLPSVLACGEWNDRNTPLIDTKEYRELLDELEDYRCKSLSLISSRLHEDIARKEVNVKHYFDSTETRVERKLQLSTEGGLRWKFSWADLDSEMKRQNAEQVDIGFCLKWHAHAYDNELSLYRNLSTAGHPLDPTEPKSLAALVQLMLLEKLDYISDDGGVTILGDAIKNVPPAFRDHVLTAIELMKLGSLEGSPFRPGTETPFPPAIKYPTPETVDSKTRGLLLISRIVSLIPMKLKKDAHWSASVDFDLAAFHSIVRVVKRTLRQLSEACLANVMLRNITRLRHLPGNVRNPVEPIPSDYTSDGMRLKEPAKFPEQERPLLPCFMLPRTCMGIVMKDFLTFMPTKKEGVEEWQATAKKKFHAATNIVADVKVAIKFFEQVFSCIEYISESVDVDHIVDDLKNADKVLKEHCALMGLHM